jgi:hypothetical protein
MDLQPDGGICVQKPDDRAVNHHCRLIRARANLQFTSLKPSQQVHLSVKIASASNYFPGMLQEDFPRVGRNHASFSSLKYLRLNAALNFLNVARQGRLRHVFGLSRAREILVFGKRESTIKKPQFNRHARNVSLQSR